MPLNSQTDYSKINEQQVKGRCSNHHHQQLESAAVAANSRRISLAHPPMMVAETPIATNQWLQEIPFATPGNKEAPKIKCRLPFT